MEHFDKGFPHRLRGQRRCDPRPTTILQHSPLRITPGGGDDRPAAVRKLISDETAGKWSESIESEEGGASWDGTGTPPEKISGSFQPWEDAPGELLQKHGQLCR